MPRDLVRALPNLGSYFYFASQNCMDCVHVGLNLIFYVAV